MNRYNQLLKRIAAEYSIVRGKTEDDMQWKLRIIYSLLGQMAIASLFDVEEEEEISIIHMKRRIENVLSGYIDMYEEITTFLPIDLSEISDEIYDIFLHTGLVYHSPNRIKCAMKSSSSVKDIKFTRGYSLEEKQKLSGLGTYIVSSDIGAENEIEKMFLLNKDTLIDRWRKNCQVDKWIIFDTRMRVEYLRTKPPYTRGYWVDKPDTDGKISVLRLGERGSESYYLYRFENQKLFASQLATWKVEDYNYRSLANARLAAENMLPETIYKYDGELVYVSFAYLPPPAELYLWKLYSWPRNFHSFPSDFNRICTRKVFEALKIVMARQGYRFKEER